MISLKAVLAILINLVILCVAIFALEDWRNFLRVRAAPVNDLGYSTRRRRLAQRRIRLSIQATLAWMLVFGGGTLLVGLPSRANEWGDWAAGLAAPIAFLWLVLGYFQQGEELRLQAKEIRNSVEQQTKAANAVREQANLMRQEQAVTLRAQLVPHQPRLTDFTSRAPNVEGRTVDIQIRNVGATFFFLEFDHDPHNNGCHFQDVPVGTIWEAGATRTLKFFFNPEMALPLDETMSHRLQFKFLDVMGFKHEQLYELILATAPSAPTAVTVKSFRWSPSLPPPIDVPPGEAGR